MIKIVLHEKIDVPCSQENWLGFMDAALYYPEYVKRGGTYSFQGYLCFIDKQFELQIKKRMMGEWMKEIGFNGFAALVEDFKQYKPKEK